MTSSFTSGKAHLEKPANGDDVDTWNVPVNGNADLTDNCLSATAILTLSNVNITLTQGQMQVLRIALLGVLTGNVTISLLSNVPGFWIVDSFTSGSFTVTLQTQAASLSVTIENGLRYIIYSDGTAVLLGDTGTATNIARNFVPPGMVSDFAMSAAPSGWLVCDGSAVSRSTYAALFANISTTWGAGNGSTTFNLPNFQGRFRRTWDQSGAIDPARAFASLQADAFKTHTHGVSDPQHSHTVPVVAAVNQAGFNNSSPLGGAGAAVTTSSSATGITVQNAGDTETRPTNYAVLTCIKT